MTDPTEARAALLREFDGSVCPACHHRVHDPGGCSECPRCELHTDEAFAFVLRYQPALATLDCNLVKHGAAPCLAALPDDGRDCAEVRRELLAKVEGLYESRHVVGYAEGKRWVRKSDVLALFEDPSR